MVHPCTCDTLPLDNFETHLHPALPYMTEAVFQVSYHETCDSPSQHKNLLQNSIRNEMLTHYNRIVIGSFKEFFQSVNMNNLAEVLQALRVKLHTG